MRAHRLDRRFWPSLPFILFMVLLSALWLAGGASTPDAFGQVVVRSVAWILLIVTILLGGRPSFGEARATWIVLLAALLIALLQLIPLPPAIWAAIPGRALLLEASTASGQPEPWRPLSIVPAATINAASSLIVPLVTLLLLTSLRDKERTWLPGVLLATVAISALLGLVQFAGTPLNNPFINDTMGLVSANFANRNHFALFMALGCLLTPTWIFMSGHRPGWRGPVGLALMLLLFLTIMASGSRAGLGLGLAAVVLGILISRQAVRKALERYPRWVFPVLLAGVAAISLLVVGLSVMADRAISIDRIFALDQGQDMRRRGAPVVLSMIRDYFPFGSGLGGFDPMFRMHEPFALLKPTYFNHAHNDFLEIVLDAGFPGLVLLLAGLGWCFWTSVVAWRNKHDVLPKLGSATMILLITSSLFDYPLRTPMMMAFAVVASVWLGAARKDSARSSFTP